MYQKMIKITLMFYYFLWNLWNRWKFKKKNRLTDYDMYVFIYFSMFFLQIGQTLSERAQQLHETWCPQGTNTTLNSDDKQILHILSSFKLRISSLSLRFSCSRSERKINKLLSYGLPECLFCPNSKIEKKYIDTHHISW